MEYNFTSAEHRHAEAATSILASILPPSDQCHLCHGPFFGWGLMMSCRWHWWRPRLKPPDKQGTNSFSHVYVPGYILHNAKLHEEQHLAESLGDCRVRRCECQQLACSASIEWHQ